MKVIEELIEAKSSQMSKNQIAEMLSAEIKNANIDVDMTQVKKELLEYIESKVAFVFNCQVASQPKNRSVYSPEDIQSSIDFACRTLGSRVYLHGTSPSFKSHWFSDWLPIGFKSKSPIVVFKESSPLTPGDCWSFPGQSGHITVVLAHMVIPTEFSIEHVPDTPGIKRSSAPRHFKVFAVDPENDTGEQLLGENEYRLDGASRQTFKARIPYSKHPVKFVQLRILSNHGHPDYTCLYRFRIYSSLSNLE